MARRYRLKASLGRLRRLAVDAGPGTVKEIIERGVRPAVDFLQRQSFFGLRPAPVGYPLSEDATGAKRAAFLNALIARNGVSSALSLGPLDPRVRAGLSLSVPVARPAVPNGGWREPRPLRSADLVMSLDVVAALGSDARFDAYMRALFASALRFVVIFARNADEPERGGRRERRFTDWIKRNRPEFIFASRVPGAELGLFGHSGAPAPEGAYPDFYIYKKLDAEVYAPPAAPLAPLSPDAQAEHRALGTLRFDIATVAYNDDLPLLRVQARSFARHFADDMVGSILYCINEKKPEKCEAFIRSAVVPLLGVHAPKARFLYLADIGPAGNDGWLTQQACKLAAAEACGCDYYLVLDAKHHLLRPVSRADLFDGTRARKPLTRARADQRPWLAASLVYFGADAAEAERPSPASAPPFMMHVQTVRSMVAEIVRREEKNLAAWFCEKSDQTTEFTLYFAYLVAKGVRDRFMVNSPSTTASLRISVGTERREKLDDELKAKNIWCFSIHRRRLSKLSVEDRYFVIQTWMQAGLFATEAEAFEEVSRLKRHFVILKGKEDKRRAMAEERTRRTTEGA